MLRGQYGREVLHRSQGEKKDMALRGVRINSFHPDTWTRRGRRLGEKPKGVVLISNFM